MNKLSISAIILTYNEEVNLEYCLRSVHKLVKDIFIIDSYSTDKTLDIAKKYTDRIYQHPFKHHGAQLNWALMNLPIETDWILNLDSDEEITPELEEEIYSVIPKISTEITGFFIKFRKYFLGRWIKHGIFCETGTLRIWRTGKVYIENILQDERIIVKEGKTVLLKNNFIDVTRKDLNWWTKKQNKFSTWEAINLLNDKHNLFSKKEIIPKLFGAQIERKRWLKKYIYGNTPLFVRPLLYFCYRYFLRFGFCDGIEGLIWHFLQGFWFRFLVDAKIYEIYKKAGTEKNNIKRFIKKVYKINLDEKLN